MENKEKTVATVNGKEIKRGDLDAHMQRIARYQNSQLPDLQTEEGKNFEQNALNHLINDVLLNQDAKNQGFEAKKEEVEASRKALENQIGGQEKFLKVLEGMGISKDKFEEDLANQIIMEQYINFVKQKNEIAVSLQEIKEFFDSKIATKNPEIKLEAVSLQIKQALEEEKLNQPISEIIQSLRKEAEIKLSL